MKVRVTGEIEIENVPKFANEEMTLLYVSRELTECCYLVGDMVNFKVELVNNNQVKE